MNEMNARVFGLYLGLDECEKVYTMEGVNLTWTDYTYDWYNALSDEEQMKPENLDNAWDMDTYYNDFDEWWLSLSEDKQKSILNRLGYNF